MQRRTNTTTATAPLFIGRRYRLKEFNVAVISMPHHLCYRALEFNTDARTNRVRIGGTGSKATASPYGYGVLVSRRIRNRFLSIKYSSACQQQHTNDKRLQMTETHNKRGMSRQNKRMSSAKPQSKPPKTDLLSRSWETVPTSQRMSCACGRVCPDESNWTRGSPPL